MDKKQQLMEYITQDLVAFLVEDYSLDYTKAMHLVYTSKLHEKILDEKTGLYLEGSAYVYDLLKNELENGVLVQSEI